MTIVDDECMDPMTWLERIRRLHGSLNDKQVSLNRQIRKAYYLVQLAPSIMSSALPPPLDEDVFEAMLAAERYDQLILSFFHQTPATLIGECSGTSNDRAVKLLTTWAGGFLHAEALHS